MSFAILLPVGLAIIMAIVGLGMTPGDFLRLRGAGAAFAAGLVVQVLGLPVLALVLATAFELSPAMSVGLVIVAAAPGGVTSNFLTLVSRGDVALSIAMTATTSLLSIVTVPIVVGFALGHFLGQSETIRLPLGMTAGSVFLVTGLPLVLGMVARAKATRLAVAVLPTARKVASLIFALIVFATFWGQWDAIAVNWRDVGPAVMSLNVLAMAGGFAVALLLRLAPAATVAIAVECGLQNVAVAMFVAINLIGEPVLAIPGMIYAISMNVAILAIIAVGRRMVPAGEAARDA